MLTACLAGLVLLASCGGGDRVSTFAPQRLIAFGDEASVITTRRQQVQRQLRSTSAGRDLMCAATRSGCRIVAQAFGLVFAQCNPGSRSGHRARTTRAPGAKVADITTQIDQHLATGSFGSRDLVTVLAGVNDIIEQYRLYPAQARSALVATVEAAAPRSRAR